MNLSSSLKAFYFAASSVWSLFRASNERTFFQLDHVTINGGKAGHIETRRGGRAIETLRRTTTKASMDTERPMKANARYRTTSSWLLLVRLPLEKEEYECGHMHGHASSSLYPLVKPTDSVGLKFNNFVLPGHSPSNYLSFEPI